MLIGLYTFKKYSKTYSKNGEVSYIEDIELKYSVPILGRKNLIDVFDSLCDGVIDEAKEKYDVESIEKYYDNLTIIIRANEKETGIRNYVRLSMKRRSFFKFLRKI